MKNNSNIPGLLLGLILSVLVISGCSSGRHSNSPIKIAGLVKWTVTFSKAVSAEEKARALIAVDKAILNELSKQGFLISTITITHNDLNIPGVTAVSIAVDVEGSTSVPGVSTVKPPKPLPRRDLQLPEDIEAIIKDISEQNVNVR